MPRQRKYSRGRKARAICQRGGHEIPYKFIMREPGTGLLVDRRWSDGSWNAVDHPRNFPPQHLTDGAPLKFATGETDKEKLTTVGTLAEVSLPGGVGLEVEEVYPSVTIISLLDEQGRQLFDESSVALVGTFNRLFYNSYRRIN